MKHLQDDKTRSELIKIRHGNNEKSRQLIRKNISPSSRFLDNYYNSKMHIKSWRPNGQIIEKK